MRGYLLERYNRFLADIETPEGDRITAYCPATGRMTTCIRRGAEVEYLRVENPDRRLNYDWWSIKMPSSWVIIDTRPANQWLYWHRTAPWLPDGWTDADWVAEPSLPDGGRLDYRLDHPSGETSWIEIKSVTWCEDKTGFFPDAPTERGRRHLRSLSELTRQGEDCYVVFVAMRSDVERIRPGRSIDPDFADALAEASGSGVHLLGLESRVEDRSLRLSGRIPVETEPA